MKAIKNLFNNPVIKMIMKVLSWVIIGLLICLAGFLMYYVISSKLYEANGKKFEPKMSLYTIISTSMEPSIKVYDVVFDVKVDASKIKEGDVITFISTSSLSEGMTITHRVINIVETENGRKFRVQGDNNSTPDTSLVDESKILGKVIFKLPQVGRIQFLLQSKGGWLFVLLIPALFVVLYDIIKVVRLSSIKSKIDESLKEPEEDEELIKKEKELKKRLSKKFVGVVPVEPVIKPLTDEDIIDKEEEKPEDNKDEEIKEKEEKKPTNNKKSKKSKGKKNQSSKKSNNKKHEEENKEVKVEKVEKEENKLEDYNINIDLDAIVNNIKNLDDDDEL